MITKSILAFVLASGLAASLVAQSTSPAQQQTPARETSTTASGTATEYKQHKTIVVREENSNPVSFVLAKTAHFVDKAGRKINEDVIRPGRRVIVHYTREGERRVAHRVEVNED